MHISKFIISLTAFATVTTFCSDKETQKKFEAYNERFEECLKEDPAKTMRTCQALLITVSASDTPQLAEKQAFLQQQIRRAQAELQKRQAQQTIKTPTSSSSSSSSDS